MGNGHTTTYYGPKTWYSGRMTTERSTREQEQVRAATRARGRALRALAKMHPDDYTRLYETEALAEGVVPNTLRRRIASGEARIEDYLPTPA